MNDPVYAIAARRARGLSRARGACALDRVVTPEDFDGRSRGEGTKDAVGTRQHESRGVFCLVGVAASGYHGLVGVAKMAHVARDFVGAEAKGQVRAVGGRGMGTL